MTDCLTIRAATRADAVALFMWRNDPVVIACSRSQAGVKWADHLIWLDRMLTPDLSGTSFPCKLWIATLEGESVGMLRIDECEPGMDGAVSIVLDQRWRAHQAHLGWQLLDLAIGEAWQAGCRGLEAVIQASNLASRRLFTRFGFLLHSAASEPWPVYHLALR